MCGTCTVWAGRALCSLFSMRASEPEMSERSLQNRVIKVLFSREAYPSSRDERRSLIERLSVIRGPLHAGASRKMAGK